jgi:uncharacterized protein (TIGR03435 family)
MKILCLALLLAQTAIPQDARFEVASIKPTESPGGGHSINNNPGRFRTKNANLAGLIRFAFGAQDFQIVGGPGWIRDAGFDIVATFTPTEADSDKEQRLARIRARVVHLLEDRFQLQLREEQREMPVYALGVEKTGTKMPRAEPLGNVSNNSGSGAGSISGKGLTMQRLSDVLSSLVERPVLDETGLSGAFDVELKYSLDTATPDAAASPKDSALAFPSLFTALKEQLGLHLNGKRGLAPVWVIVKAEKPTEN